MLRTGDKSSGGSRVTLIAISLDTCELMNIDLRTTGLTNKGFQLHGKITLTSWEPDGELSYEQWAEDGITLYKDHRSLNWRIGDWLNYGERRYGEMYAQAIEWTGNNLQYLKDLKWVCSAVKTSSREDVLSFTHHKYVAHLSDTEQRLWLEAAVTNEWSSRELQQALAEAGAKRKPLAQPQWAPEEKLAQGVQPVAADSDYEQLADDLASDEHAYNWSVPAHITIEDEHGHQETMLTDWAQQQYSTAHSGDNATSNGAAIPQRPHVANNSGNNEWYTPAEYIEAARNVLGAIELDPASSDIANSKVCALSYYTANDSGLEKEWTGKVWMNPPYSSGLIERFTEKLCFHYERGDVQEAIVLVNNATETVWFQRVAQQASMVCFPKRRVKFWKPDGETGDPLQGQAILYLGRNHRNFSNQFSAFGFTAIINEL